MANRGRQHSHDSLGFGNTPKGPVFDTSLTVSSVMNLQTKPNSNLARKASLPKNLRGLKNSLINDQLETSDMHLMTSLYGNERDSKELPDLRVGSKNDNRLGHPGNLHALEKRHKMRKGIVTEQDARYAPGYFPPSIESENRKFASSLAKRILLRI